MLAGSPAHIHCTEGEFLSDAPKLPPVFVYGQWVYNSKQVYSSHCVLAYMILAYH